MSEKKRSRKIAYVFEGEDVPDHLKKLVDRSKEKEGSTKQDNERLILPDKDDT